MTLHVVSEDVKSEFQIWLTTCFEFDRLDLIPGFRIRGAILEFTDTSSWHHVQRLPVLYWWPNLKTLGLLLSLSFLHVADEKWEIFESDC